MIKEHELYSNPKVFEAVDDFNGRSTQNITYPKEHPPEELASNNITLAVLKFLVASIDAKRVLEIGTYAGNSALVMAEAMPSVGIIHTIEKGAEFAELAKSNISKNRHKPEIYVLNHDALSLLDVYTLQKPKFDLIFLDADKQNYPYYFYPLLRLLRRDGLLVVDDVLFNGEALEDTPENPKAFGCRQLLELAQDSVHNKVLLPVGNGMLIVQKT